MAKVMVKGEVGKVVVAVKQNMCRGCNRIRKGMGENGVLRYWGGL